MTERNFDRCPSCGCLGQFGLRSHPKFSTCFEGTTDGYPDMVMAYFHRQEHNDAFAATPGLNVLHKQRWNPTDLRWEEYH